MAGRAPETQAGTGKPSDMSPSPAWVKTSVTVGLCTSRLESCSSFHLASDNRSAEFSGYQPGRQCDLCEFDVLKWQTSNGGFLLTPENWSTLPEEK